jgi:hypothetical protein
MATAAGERHRRGPLCARRARRGKPNGTIGDSGTSQSRHHQLLDLPEFASYFGLVIAVRAVVYRVFFILRKIILSNPVLGYPSLLVVVPFPGGIPVITIGVILAYIGRIFNETRDVHFTWSRSTTERSATSPCRPGLNLREQRLRRIAAVTTRRLSSSASLWRAPTLLTELVTTNDATRVL